MKRIGIYGGAFNPPHVGHVRGALYAVSALGLDKLLVIPSCVSPHKPLPANSPTPQQRLEMLKLALPETEVIFISDMEIVRGGLSYTHETVAQIKNLYPDSELVLIVGTDMFLSLLQWKYAEPIRQMASLGVLYRGDKNEINAIAEQKRHLEEMGIMVYLAENPVTAISSTDIRRMLVFECADAFLPPQVLAYIREKGLYGADQQLHGLTEQQLQAQVIQLLKPSRVAHVLGCRDTAVELAKKWGADSVDAARAALLHDVTKALDSELQLTLCNAYGIMLDDFSAKNPKTLHALTGSLVAQRIFGENAAVVSAIRSHTTGKADMNMLEKIIYVADYMEPNRDFPGVQELRRLAYADIDGAMQLGLEMTLDMLRQQGREISPESQQALAFLKGRDVC